MIQTSESDLTGIRVQGLRPFLPLVAVEQLVFVVVQVWRVAVGQDSVVEFVSVAESVVVVVVLVGNGLTVVLIAELALFVEWVSVVAVVLALIVELVFAVEPSAEQAAE